MQSKIVTIQRIIEEEVEVFYIYHEEQRGYRDSLGVPEEPDEPAYIEIDSIMDGSGAELCEDEIVGGLEAIEKLLED